MAQILADSAFDYRVVAQGDVPAVRDDQRGVSYAQLNRLVHQAIGGLRYAGLRPGDRFAVICKNRLECMVLLLAALKSGMVCVPVNRRNAPTEMLWVVRDARCTALFADAECAAHLDGQLVDQIPTALRFCVDDATPGWQDFWSWLEAQVPSAPMHATDPARPYLQIYTSGTSGRPKGVVLTAGNCLGQLTAIVMSLDVSLMPGETLFEGLPLFHVGGVFAAMWALSQGATLLLRQDFQPHEIDGLLRSGELAHAALVPAMLQACLAVEGGQVKDYAGLKTVMYGASPVARTVLKAAMDRYDCDFAQIYGMSETHSVISALSCEDHRKIASDDDAALATSAGRAVAGTDLRICDPRGAELEPGQVGEIRVSSSHVMTEYWRAPEATAAAIQDGHLCTGDAGYLDDQGYLYIVDRLKDIIVSGGENVSSLEVESVLLQHESVADAAVIGTPCEQWGEQVTALIVPRGELREEDVAAHCRRQLGAYKLPRRFEYLDVIPRNAAGKALKAKLREQYWTGQGRHVA